jgi:hypothetical protein
MLFVVGNVMLVLLKTPFITPTTMKPFIFVIAAVNTIEFKPAIGSSMLIVGVEKT